MASRLYDRRVCAHAGGPRPGAAPSFAERLIVWMWRQWWCGRHATGRPTLRYWQAWRCLGDDAAGLRFDLFAEVLAGLAPRPLMALPPCALDLGADEGALLCALRAWQHEAACAPAACAPLVPLARQSALLDWAGREAAAALLVCGLDLTAAVRDAGQARFRFASGAKSL
ncbi:MAG: hypothetical protein D6782_01955 [Alphaproteobacteria bacterium]|nr:MAG: hypothetical protein D6782_01955 [Alphaproteobacteria bacterium]